MALPNELPVSCHSDYRGQRTTVRRDLLSSELGTILSYLIVQRTVSSIAAWRLPCAHPVWPDEHPAGDPESLHLPDDPRNDVGPASPVPLDDLEL